MLCTATSMSIVRLPEVAFAGSDSLAHSRRRPSCRAETGHFTPERMREEERSLMRFPRAPEHAIKSAVIVVSGVTAF